MIIVGVTLAVLAVGIVGIIWIDDYTHSGWHFVACMGTGGAGILFLVELIALPIEAVETRGEIAQMESVRATVETARARGESIENAAIQIKVAEVNQWLAGKQYWNGTVFGAWIPDEVMHIQPIR